MVYNHVQYAQNVCLHFHVEALLYLESSWNIFFGLKDNQLSLI